MHVYYKFGLFIIFMISVSKIYSKAVSSSAHNNITDDYYSDDDYDYNDEQISTEASQPSTTRKTLTSTFLALFDSIQSDSDQSLDTMLDLPKLREAQKCPTECICKNDNTNIICSGRNLTNIPTNIPSTAVTLDLSNNQISQIPAGVFNNINYLKEINLNNNLLTNIEKEVFSNLPKLERLSLANNKLTEISADTFSDAYKLSALNLNNNSIVLPKEGSFLHQPSLIELLLRNSSLTEIYDETFSNLSSLKTLKLDGNFFNKKINTKAFEPLKDLIKLKLPELEKDYVRQLCNILQSIDNISLKRSDISCYMLVNGNSFDDSIIITTEAPLIIPYKRVDPTKSPVPVPIPTSKPVKPAVMTYTNMTESRKDDEELTVVMPTESAAINVTTTTESAYKVAISQEAINYSLISIIVIAVIGLLIGLICRKDVGGIKTKCCRRRKPPPGDQVRPAEEIPLNKIG